MERPSFEDLRLHVSSSGSGSPSVVLVHGFGANGRSWRGWLPELSSRHRVYNVDLMGFGQAPAPRQADYSPLAQAGRLAQFLQRVAQQGPMVVVGHSLGAGIMLLAVAGPESTGTGAEAAGLVVVSGAVYPQAFPRYMSLARIRGIGDLFTVATPPRWVFRFGLRGLVGDPRSVTADLVDSHRSAFRNRSRRRAALQAARHVDLRGAGPLLSNLGQLDVPTLLLWGEEDRIVRVEAGRRLAAEMPRARLVTLPGVGHLPAEEAPRQSLLPVLEFLSSLRQEGVETAPGRE